MKCPRCGSLKTKVMDSRKRDGLTRRARSCEDCYKWFYTVEILEDEYKKMRKEK
jgi:transcriptional regulator NrdR family protein